LAVRLVLPEAPLQQLEMETLFILPHVVSLFGRAPWHKSLTMLRLGAVTFDDVLDLSTFDGLQELLLTDAQLDVSRLRLPIRAPLRTLGLKGRNLPALLHQLAHAQNLRTLRHLELCIDPLSGGPVQVPWHAMPELQSLVLDCSTPQPLDLRRLGLPDDNRIETLVLRGRALTLREDRTLKEQPLPHLRHLDICRYRLTQAQVAELGRALAQPGHWPRLERLTIMPTGVRREIKQTLVRLAERYQLELMQAWTPEHSPAAKD
jgi:hypothetical protein